MNNNIADSAENKNLIVVSGEVIEKSMSSIHSGDDTPIGKKYAFIMLKSDNDEVIKINNFTSHVNIEQHISIGDNVKLFIKPILPLFKFDKINVAVAAQSDIGIGVIDVPLRALIGIYYMTIFMGGIVAAIVGFLLGFSTSSFALGILACIAVFGYFLSFPINISSIRSNSLRLKKEFTKSGVDKYHGKTIRSI